MHTPATEGAPEAVEYRGKVRPRDRDTSWAAASEQTNDKTGALQVRIYGLLLADGPKTHSEIHAALTEENRLAWRSAPALGREAMLSVTESGVRTRTSELEHAGWVRAVEDRKGTSPTGRPATLWRAVLDSEPAPIVQPPLPVKPKTPRTSTPDHDAGLAAARRWAAWEIGDASHADRIVEAYTDPEHVNRLLDEEGAP